MFNSANLLHSIFKMIIWYPFVYIFTSMWIPSVTNKISILLLILIYMYFLTSKLFKNTYVAGVSLVILLYSAYFGLTHGISYLIHVDFYSYILFGLYMCIFSKKEIITEFLQFLLSKRRQYAVMIAMFMLVLACSVLFAEGMEIGYGASMPVLYGPYSVPHILGYQMIVLYCAAAIFYRNSISYERKTFWLVIKGICTICAVWTAARSAVLALAIVIIVDYLSIRKVNRKAILAIMGVLALVYLVFFTDLLVTNPLIQKTIASAQSGSISNNRDRFAKYVLEAFTENTSWHEKLLGMGMDGIRNVLKNSPNVNVAIHAHNDYVNALCAYGIIGFIVFLLTQIKPLKLWSKWYIKLLLFATIFVLAYTNGIAMYLGFSPCLLVVFVYGFVSCNAKSFQFRKV